MWSVVALWARAVRSVTEAQGRLLASGMSRLCGVADARLVSGGTRAAGHWCVHGVPACVVLLWASTAGEARLGPLPDGGIFILENQTVCCARGYRMGVSRRKCGRHDKVVPQCPVWNNLH